MGYDSVVITSTRNPAVPGSSPAQRHWGPFLEAPGNYRARKAVLFSILEGSFRSFENYTVELLANETKWTSLEDRTHPTFLETLIQKYDSGPVKLPGLSRNGPLAPCWICSGCHEFKTSTTLVDNQLVASYQLGFINNPVMFYLDYLSLII